MTPPLVPGSIQTGSLLSCCGASVLIIVPELSPAAALSSPAAGGLYASLVKGFPLKCSEMRCGAPPALSRVAAAERPSAGKAAPLASGRPRPLGRKKSRKLLEPLDQSKRRIVGDLHIQHHRTRNRQIRTRHARPLLTASLVKSHGFAPLPLLHCPLQNDLRAQRSCAPGADRVCPGEAGRTDRHEGPRRLCSDLVGFPRLVGAAPHHFRPEDGSGPGTRQGLSPRLQDHPLWHGLRRGIRSRGEQQGRGPQARGARSRAQGAADAHQSPSEHELTSKRFAAQSTLDTLVANKKKPVFTTALIAGDCVILDAIAKAGYLDKIEVTAFCNHQACREAEGGATVIVALMLVIFIDTFHLFPETLDFLKEVEAHYGFKASVYHCADCNTPEEYWEKYGEDSWMTDIDEYDRLCKVEPLQRALKETEADAWINGRRRDHGAERAALPVWEAFKVNPLAFWSFEVRFRILVGATRRFGFRIS
eukprot:scaffold47_cov258-Pinguiococcus_pyrenoidosus.AAC.87